MWGSGPYPGGWHVRMTRVAVWVGDQTNTLRCQTLEVQHLKWQGRGHPSESMS